MLVNGEDIMAALRLQQERALILPHYILLLCQRTAGRLVNPGDRDRQTEFQVLTSQRLGIVAQLECLLTC